MQWIQTADRMPVSNTPDGIHGQRRAWKLAGVGGIDALADTIERLTA
jgi:hypothetical protein